MREAPVGYHCPDDAALGRQPAPRTSIGARLRSSPPAATLTFVAVNVAVYLYCGATSAGGINRPEFSRLFQDWVLQPYIVHSQDEYWRFVTAAFLHLSVIHIVANMVALAVIGPPLERLVGRSRFVVLYLLAALGGSVAVFAFGGVMDAVAGASGAIFGLFAAAVVLARRIGLDVQWLVGIIALNFVFTFTVPGISWLGHVGGFVTGGLCALALGGRPVRRTRLPNRVQALGLAGIVVLLALVTLVRAGTTMTGVV
ncbi:MAG: rhomboid family intramembrane serine protease [Jatrophihabitans sp.]|nr:MAG: rhomboid family intramembrane serine protease [Jatrophihabitans sp.]